MPPSLQLVMQTATEMQAEYDNNLPSNWQQNRNNNTLFLGEAAKL